MTPVDRIQLAQDFFRFSYLVGSPISFGQKVILPFPPTIRAWGKHILTRDELMLDQDKLAICGTILDRLAYRLLAMELDAALSAAFQGKDRLNHGDQFIRDSSVVIRLIRNAVAHNPLDPVWKIDRNLRNRIISIEGVLEFNTTNLHGKQLERIDFGGPLALFRLSELIVEKLNSDLCRQQDRSGGG